MKAKAIKLNLDQKENTTAVARAVAFSVLSFILSAAKIFGTMSPLGIAFLAAVPKGYLIASFISSLIGSYLFVSPAYTLYHIVLLCVVFAWRIAQIKLLRLRARPLLLSLTCGALAIGSALIFTAISQSAFLQLSLMVIEGLLAGSFTYFFATAASSLQKNREMSFFGYVEIASIIILCITAITAICSFQIMQINLGVIAGVVAIYIAMTRYRIIGASIASICVAISLCMYSMNMLMFCGILIISGFIAGVFSPLNKFIKIASFIGSSTFCTLLIGAPMAITYHLISIFFASAIFVLIPSRFFSIIDASTSVARSESNTQGVSQTGIQTKLKFASDTINDLQKDLVEVSKRFLDIDYNNISTVYETTANRVCRGCSRQLGCWDASYSDTMDAFTPLNRLLRQRSGVTVKDMPQYFKDNCCKLEKLADGINESYMSFTQKEVSKRQLLENRSIVVEQFQSIANMLMEVSEDFGDIVSYDEKLSQKALEAFCEAEYEPEQLICAVDRFGRCCIEIYTPHKLNSSARKLCQLLCEAADRDFDLPSISTIGSSTKLAFFEKATYTVDFCANQACSNDNSVCGDSYEYFLDAKGYAYMILSDGMGNGKRAAIDSVMTCSLLLKLIKAGFGLVSAIKLINSSLLVKSTDESLATIDITRIDLYTGKTEFIKAGAAPSYLYTKGSSLKIESSSLPAGILQGIDFDKTLAILRSGDIVAMVSDGVCDDGTDWVEQTITASSHMTAREISARLLHEAKQRSNHEHPDDITVMIAKINKGV